MTLSNDETRRQEVEKVVCGLVHTTWYTLLGTRIRFVTCHACQSHE